MPAPIKYLPEVYEYLLVRSEQINNITHIAVEIKDKFNLGESVETLRRNFSKYLQRNKTNVKRADIKRLFFDIETSYYLVPVFGLYNQNINSDSIIRDKKIICIAYKWEGSDDVNCLVWNKKQDDSMVVKKFIDVIKNADELVAHNGDKFDIREIRTRAMLNGHLMFPNYRTLDTLKKSRQYFRFPSNRLDYLGKILNVGEKTKHEGMKMWIDIVEHNDSDALERMIEYCKNDVILLEDVYTVFKPYIYHNTNMAILHGGEKWHCPECASENTKLSHVDATAMGYIKRHMKCLDCRKFFIISNRTYLRMLESMFNKKTINE